MWWGKKAKSVRPPSSLTLLDGWMAMDGGSTRLRTRGDGREILLHLDWSIAAQQAAKTQLFVTEIAPNRSIEELALRSGGRPIPKRSPEEADWLALVRAAAARLPAFDPDRPMQRKGIFLLPPEDLAYFKAMEQGPEIARRVLAERFANLVESEAYGGEGADDAIRAMVAEGRRVEAVQAYRELHPGATTAEARAAVARIAAELGR